MGGMPRQVSVQKADASWSRCLRQVSREPGESQACAMQITDKCSPQAVKFWRVSWEKIRGLFPTRSARP